MPAHCNSISATMFNQFKDRFAEKWRNLGPQDDLDRAIQALVEAGSRELLSGPDWNVSMQLVDLVNNSPEPAPEKLCRIVNRTLATKPAVRTQVLALTMLDTCMRNCHPNLHYQLAQSLLWADLLKVVLDTSVTRIDLEVRDRILTMVEDYGTQLKHIPAFVQAYESLVDQGIDFPVRSSEDVLPIEPYIPSDTSPQDIQHGVMHTSPAAAAAAAPTTGGFFSNLLNTFNPDRPTATSAGGSPPQSESTYRPPQISPPGSRPTGRRSRGGAAVDPAVLQGLSDEDRAAVESAMAEMALEMESAQEAAAMAASMRDTEPGQNEGAPTGQEQRRTAQVQLPEDNEQALQVISSSVSLFSDMVSGVPDEEPEGVKDPVIRDLADQCSQYRSRLAQMAGELTDEAQLVQALGLNDTLGAAFARYDALLAQALSTPPTLPTTASDTAVRAAAAASAITAPVAPDAHAGTFTLLDEEEEDSAAGNEPLLTRRQQATAGALPSSIPPSVPAANNPDLLDLLGEPVPGAGATGGAHVHQALPHVDLAPHQDAAPAASPKQEGLL